MSAYQENLDESAITSVESSLVGLMIVRLFKQQEENGEEEAGWWQGEMSQLHETLSGLLADKEVKDKRWPASPRALGHALRRLAPALRRAGFGFEQSRSALRRIIVLTQSARVGKRTSQTSQTSSTREEPEKGTSSHIVTEIPTSSSAPQGNDDDDANDVSFPTLHAAPPDLPKEPPESAGLPGSETVV